MPIKKLGFEKNYIRLRIDDVFQNDLNKFLETHEKDFESNSHFIRSALSEYIDKEIILENKETAENNIQAQIDANNEKINELYDMNKRYMDLLDKKLSENNENPESIELRQYQSQIILNLIAEEPRDEAYLSEKLDMNLGDVLRILNGFIKIGKIAQDGIKYRMVRD